MQAEWDPRRLTSADPAPRAFVAITVALFLLVTAIVAAQHEMWRDEGDAWLFARDGDFAHLVDWTRHAGTPALWYLVLAPLARSGAPAEGQQVLHLAIITAAVAVFLAFAPFTRLTKILTVFSYYFIYEYAVVVRSYALSILLIAIAAALHRKRPIAYAIVLALLFNTNAQSFVVAGTLALLFATRERKPLPLAIMAAGAFAAWWQVRAPADPMRAGGRHLFDPGAAAWTLANAFLPAMPLIAGVAIGAAILIALTIALEGDARLVLWLPLVALFAIYSFIWIGGFRHAGFVLVVVLLAIWIARDVNAPAAALLLNGALLISVAAGARAAISDIQSPFSGSREMAQWMRANGLGGRPVAAHNLTQCEAVLAYLPPRMFWYAGQERDGSFMTWDAAFERALDVPYPLAELRARRHFAGRRDWLLLFNVEMPDQQAHGFRLLHATPQPFEKTDERFWLYAPIQ